MARTIIVGDVHGCVDELLSLLDEVRFSDGERLVFVGDMVARGPGTLQVLDLFAELSAEGVMGNHEWRILQVRDARLRGERGLRLGPNHERLMTQLEDRHWALLSALPLYRDYPEHGLRVVHAGIAPDLPFEQQDEWTLLHVRTLEPDGRPTAHAGFEPWGRHYGRGPHLVFGHNSRALLQLHPNATGLDTACVYGEQLSALVLASDEPVPSDTQERSRRISSVPARRAYYPA